MLRLSRVFVAFAVLTVVAAATERREPIKQAKPFQCLEESSRDRRATNEWVANPSPAHVRYNSVRTKIFAKIYRAMISFERRIYDITATSSQLALASYLAAGVILTFFVLFVPLWLLFNAPSLVLAAGGRRKRDLFDYDAGHNIDQLNGHLEFELAEWKEQFARWALESRPVDKRFRCCILPTSVCCHPFVEARSLNSPCPQDVRQQSHVTIDHDFRLAFH